MSTKLNRFKVRHMVVALLVKKNDAKEKFLLCGMKKRNRPHDPCTGMVVPPGGKISQLDLGKISAAERETREEAGLGMENGRTVARLNVRFHARRRWNIVHVVLCTQWTGHLKRHPEEFAWLKFIRFSELPWKDMPPGDVKWLKAVLFKGRKVIVSIDVSNRLDRLLRPPRIRLMK